MKLQSLCVAMVREVHSSVMPALRAGDAEIADQLHRSARSAALNVSEGFGLLPGKRQRNHFRIALGSAREAMMCVELAVATGVIEEAQVAAAVDRIDHVCAILFKLVRVRAA